MHTTDLLNYRQKFKQFFTRLCAELSILTDFHSCYRRQTAQSEEYSVYQHGIRTMYAICKLPVDVACAVDVTYPMFHAPFVSPMPQPKSASRAPASKHRIHLSRAPLGRRPTAQLLRAN